MARVAAFLCWFGCTALGGAVLMLWTAKDAIGQTVPAVVGLHVISGHKRAGHEDVNPGVFVRWPSGFTVGTFRNSERRASACAGWTFPVGQGEHFALTLGLASGYSLAPLVPMVVPSVRLPVTERAAVRLSYVVAKNNPAVHLSLEWRL